MILIKKVCIYPATYSRPSQNIHYSANFGFSLLNKMIELPSFIFLFRLGAHFKFGSIGTEQDFMVEKVIVHPSYNRPIGLSNDIALVKLNRPASPTSFVASACLPNAATPFGFAAGKYCWVTGQ